ncbi:IMPACT family protein [Portibacter marinus]|uniref:IMPACT family protein n=1 Tax=Portibacter marinus TaxID=2898660 RepID=UPI001F3628A2|nr:YigZ family protein [Portibacter marinus]
MLDSYLTIKDRSEALFKEKSSKFFAYAVPVFGTEDLETFIDALKKQHPKAGHFCYAYYIGVDRQQYRANDDGEPSGTAGKPILGQLDKRNLTNCAVVVVRYFGGTKLGVSGLISAYKEAAALALESGQIIERIIAGQFVITAEMEYFGPLMHFTSTEGIRLIDSKFADRARLTCETRKSQVEAKIKLLKAQLLERPPQDIDEDTVVPGVQFEIIE